MPFHLVAYTVSADQAALAAIPPVADQVIRTSGNDLYVPRDWSQVIGAYGVGVNLNRYQLRAPSMLNYWYFEAANTDYSAEPTNVPPVLDMRFTPLQLAQTEALDVFASEDGAGATRMNVFLWLADGPVTPVEADIRTLRFTNTSTLAAFAWTNGQLTADQQLPAGEYEVVGMRAESAGLLAARLVFQGQIWRPGVIGCDAPQDIMPPFHRRGGLGSFGRFFHDALPSVDFFSISADSSQVVYLDLIQRSRI